MHEPKTWMELDAAVDALWARAYPAIHALRGLDAVAAQMMTYANDAIAQVEREMAIVAEPRYIPLSHDVDADRERTDIYATLGLLCHEMQGLQAFCAKTSAEHDHQLKPLRDEALALLATCQSIGQGGGAAAVEQPQPGDLIHEAALKKWRDRAMLLDREQGGSVFYGVVIGRPRLKLRELASTCVWMLDPLSQWLAALDHRAQHQRGAWALIGAELTNAAAPLADRTSWEGPAKWKRSPIAAPLMLERMRKVAAQATEFTATPHEPT